MLKSRWFKVLNDLWGNKTRTGLIVLSIAVGLFAVGTIVSARAILTEGMAESFAAINPSSGTVRTDELFEEDFIQAAFAQRRKTLRNTLKGLIDADELEALGMMGYGDYCVKKNSRNRTRRRCGGFPAGRSAS